MTESPGTVMRTAAAKLRQLVLMLPRDPWQVEMLGEKGYPQRLSNSGGSIIAETFETSRTRTDAGAVETTSFGIVPSYLALMEPPTAWHLAELLEAAAANADREQCQVPESLPIYMAYRMAVLLLEKLKNLPVADLLG